MLNSIVTTKNTVVDDCESRFDISKEQLMSKIVQQEAFIKKLCGEPDKRFEKITLEISDLSMSLKKSEIENLRLETVMNLMHQRSDVDYQSTLESLQEKVNQGKIEIERFMKKKELEIQQIKISKEKENHKFKSEVGQLKYLRAELDKKKAQISSDQKHIENQQKECDQLNAIISSQKQKRVI